MCRHRGCRTRDRLRTVSLDEKPEEFQQQRSEAQQRCQRGQTATAPQWLSVARSAPFETGQSCDGGQATWRSVPGSYFLQSGIGYYQLSDAEKRDEGRISAVGSVCWDPRSLWGPSVHPLALIRWGAASEFLLVLSRGVSGHTTKPVTRILEAWSMMYRATMSKKLLGGARFRSPSRRTLPRVSLSC